MKVSAKLSIQVNVILERGCNSQLEKTMKVKKKGKHSQRQRIL